VKKKKSFSPVVVVVVVVVAVVVNTSENSVISDARESELRKEKNFEMHIQKNLKSFL